MLSTSSASPKLANVNVLDSPLLNRSPGIQFLTLENEKTKLRMSQSIRLPSVARKLPHLSLSVGNTPGQLLKNMSSTCKNEVTKQAVTTDFSLQVATQVIQENLSNNKSMVCSPVSIDAVLSILALAVENSTLDQLLTLLGYDDARELNNAACKLRDILKVTENDDASKISFVNGLWLNQQFSLKPAFQNFLKDVHKADVRAVDFANQADQVVDEVNSWAEQETKGLIKQVLSRRNINNDTLLILGNALYFKGNWEKHFMSKNTKDDDFNLLNGDKIQVPMMNQWHKYLEYQTSDSCQVLKMPYKRGSYSDGTKQFSMYVFLPHEKNGLPNLMNEIRFDTNLFKKLNFVKIRHLSIPKFKFECDIDLKEPMKRLGLLLPFEESCMDFSGMIDVCDPVNVSDISQKCFVETNELGTTAAAVTLMHAVGCNMSTYPPPPPINFVADHPFMFVIREDVSGALLFVGTVLDPR